MISVLILSVFSITCGSASVPVMCVKADGRQTGFYFKKNPRFFILTLGPLILKASCQLKIRIKFLKERVSGVLGNSIGRASLAICNSGGDLQNNYHIRIGVF